MHEVLLNEEDRDEVWRQIMALSEIKGRFAATCEARSSESAKAALASGIAWIINFNLTTQLTAFTGWLPLGRLSNIVAAYGHAYRYLCVLKALTGVLKRETDAMPSLSTLLCNNGDLICAFFASSCNRPNDTAVSRTAP